MHSKNTALISLFVALSGVLAAPVAQNGMTTSCTADGKTVPHGTKVCMDNGKKMATCVWGKMMMEGADGSMPAGTMCQNGMMVAIGGKSSGPAAGANMGSGSGTGSGAAAPMNPNPAPKPTPPPQAPQDPSQGSGSGNGQVGGGEGQVGSPQQPPQEPEPKVSTIVVSVTATTTIGTVVTETAAPTDGGSQNVEQPAPVPSAPAPAPSPPASSGGGSSDFSAKELLAISPVTKDCSGADPKECATADTAAPFIAEAFAKYKINAPNEKAAVLSNMLFESGDFKFNINHNPAPGRPGQGTRNMMMPNFVYEYAASIPELADQLKKAAPGITSGDQLTNASDDVKNAVRALVLPNKYSFASGAWFYATKCTDAQKKGLQAPGDGVSAFVEFAANCVHVGSEVGDDRKSRFTTAAGVLSKA